MEERLHPRWVAGVDAGRFQPEPLDLLEGRGEVGHLEGEVVRAGAVTPEKASEEVVRVRGVGHEEFDPCSVPEAQLRRSEPGAFPARAPTCTEIDRVAAPGVLPPRDGVRDVVQGDAGDMGTMGVPADDHGTRLLGSGAPCRNEMSRRGSAGRGRIERLSAAQVAGTVGTVDFRTETVVGLAQRVREGHLRASELVDHSLAQIEAHNPTINAFVAVDAERARAAAAALDERIDSGGDPGPLAGIPIGVKDLEDAAGFVTTHGSKAFADDPPKSTDSALVARLVAAGCVVVGKTNTPELGWKADTDNSVFGPTANPWNLDHTPGGSSGGSAAALAAGMVPLATGSDGGGSIRIPSSCCGLSGVKPSLGRVPSGGDAPPDWQHLSTKGPMARRLSDVVAALDIVVGPDPSDLRSLPRPEASWLAVLEDPKPPRKVAWSPTLGYAEIDDEVRSDLRPGRGHHGLARHRDRRSRLGLREGPGGRLAGDVGRLQPPHRMPTFGVRRSGKRSIRCSRWSSTARRGRTRSTW